MTVNFCVANAKWPTTGNFLGCGFDPLSADERTSTVTPTITPTIKLGSLNLSCEKCTSEMFRDRLKAALALPDDADDIWRWRTIYSLAQHESLVCINFIPKDPSKDHIAHVMRTPMCQEDIEAYRLYYHDFLQIKYVLPVEHPSRVFDLSADDQLKDLEGTEIGPALDCFSKDSRSLGMAVTFKARSGALMTYVWLKI